jgi:anionic cell wall polymer biosynthesis LytR-Cps2A-Psr (LCP) family protein
MDPNDPAAQRDTTSDVALADVVMLVRIDPGLRRAAVLSIPRDLYLPIYRDGVPVREEKLASALIVGGIGRGAPTPTSPPGRAHRPGIWGGRGLGESTGPPPA